MLYLILYFLIAILALNNDRIKDLKYLEWFIFILLILFAGIRWEVGGDWATYLKFYDRIDQKNPSNSILFYGLNAASKIFHLESLGRNLFLITIFITPFFYIFKKYYENIYLSFVIFFPIIYLIYGLGSIRQGLAISFFYFFLYYNGNRFNKIILSIVPIVFHNSALFIVFFYYISQLISFKDSKKYLRNIIIAFSGAIVIFLISFGQIKFYISNYMVDEFYYSGGALLRASLLSFVSILYFLNFKKLQTSNTKLNNFLLLSSLFVIFIAPFSIFYSTPVDRVLAYFLILKLIILHEILKLTEDRIIKKFIYITIISVGFLYMVTWLYLGENAIFWLNFESYFM